MRYFESISRVAHWCSCVIKTVCNHRDKINSYRYVWHSCKKKERKKPQCFTLIIRNRVRVFLYHSTMAFHLHAWIKKKNHRVVFYRRCNPRERQSKRMHFDRAINGPLGNIISGLKPTQEEPTRIETRR